MSNKIKQKDINDAAWAACDTFRGVVDPAQYKDYILVMLFLKYITDVWQDHFQSYKKQYGHDDVRIKRKLERERFVLPDKASFYYLYENRNEPNIGELINEALYAIEDKNKLKLEGVFRNINFNSEANLGRTKDRNRRLKLLLEDFHKPQLDMRPSLVPEDVIGNTYIYLIEKFASDAGKKAGEFYTPHKVSELVAKLAMPKSGDRICDPACGSGGLLIEAARQVGNRDFSLYGMEVNGSTWALARMNMFLHGKDSARLEWGDTLNNPLLVENDQLMKYDTQVCNMPFSLKKWGAENAEADKYKRFWRGVPPKDKGDFAFLTHMIETAKPKTGRVAAIAPHGVLFRGGAEGKIREQLLKENIIDAVIGLPAGLFQTTGIPVAILIIDRSREKGGANEKKKDVLFIEASKEFKPGKAQNTLTEENIEKIYNTYAKRKEIEKFSRKVSFKEIKENDFNLNITRYVDTFEEEAPVDIKANLKELAELEPEIEKLEKEMEKYLKELKIK